MENAKGYKAFSPGMICRGKRYAENTDYEETDSVICCAGSGSVVKAKAGSWITLAEWEYSDEKGRFVPRYVKTEYVDGEKIKADTWYCLKNGEFVEAE